MVYPSRRRAISSWGHQFPIGLRGSGDPWRTLARVQHDDPMRDLINQWQMSITALCLRPPAFGSGPMTKWLFMLLLLVYNV